MSAGQTLFWEMASRLADAGSLAPEKQERSMKMKIPLD